jgi:replicative DNA helicase
LNDYICKTLAWGMIFSWNIDKTFDTAYNQLKRDSSLWDMKSTAEEIISWIRMWKSPNELMQLVNKFYVYQTEEKTVEDLTEEILWDMSWENEVVSYKTGFKNLDIYLNGFLPWQLNIIAGTSSTGKSLIAVNFILKHLVDSRKVAFFSLEMTNKEILQRMFANLTWTPMNAIKDKTSKENYDKVKSLAKDFKTFIDWNLFMYDNKLTLAWIVSEIRALKRKTHLDLVYIDYLGIISVAKWENRNLEVATITRTLKLLAKELKITIVALAQLNREADKWDRVPELSHLRDSWAIWQDADDVIMALNLWKSFEWEDKYTEEQRKQILRFYIRKNRNWPTWEADLRVIYSKMQLTDDLSFSDSNPF